jgi:DNA-binding transcriptional LysR family regulator
MEIYELRYFLAVAKHENIHKASGRLNVSTASLSKAISRLEDQLGVRLFHREGRGIRLSDHGLHLQKRAAEILALEEQTRGELGGNPGAVQIVIAGPEILLSKFGTEFSVTLKRKLPGSIFDFQAMDETAAVESVYRGEARLALISGDVQLREGMSAKLLSEAKFQTFVGRTHPLYPAAKAKRTVAVEQVLEHPFASPDRAFLGQVGAKQSLDGWRDDKFPRRIEFVTSSLKILEELVASGFAIAYLPDYLGEVLPVARLKISGCPYTCVQRIRLVAKNPKNTGWLNQLF